MIDIIVARVANCNYAPIIFWSLPVANNGQRPVCSKHEKIYETIVEWPRLSVIFFPPSSVSTLCTPTEKRYVTQNAAQCAHFLKRPYQWDNTIVHLWKCDKCCNFTFRQQRHGNEKKISWNQIVQSGTDLKFLSMLLNLIWKNVMHYSSTKNI